MMIVNEAWHHAAFLAGVIPDPDPSIPKGVSDRISTLLGWWKWGGLAVGMFGLIGCGAMMGLGRRNRSSMAVEGAVGVPWVLMGLTLVVLASSIVGVFA